MMMMVVVVVLMMVMITSKSTRLKVALVRGLGASRYNLLYCLFY